VFVRKRSTRVKALGHGRQDSKGDSDRAARGRAYHHARDHAVQGTQVRIQSNLARIDTHFLTVAKCKSCRYETTNELSDDDAVEQFEAMDDSCVANPLLTSRHADIHEP
jgi:hypothetical protein